MNTNVDVDAMRKDAVEIFQKGFACSESVIYAIKKGFDLDLSDDAIAMSSGFTGGIGKLAGPTGGYIIGFIPMAIIAGIVIDKFSQRWIQILGMIVGTAICYAFGTAWFCIQAGYTVSAALAVCVIPFIPADLIKMVIAMIIGPEIRKRLGAVAQ